MTVMNALYPITTDAIYAICSPFGMVQRIVIFVKRDTQVLVEFDSVSPAARAKASLNGVCLTLSLSLSQRHMCACACCVRVCGPSHCHLCQEGHAGPGRV